MTDSDLLTRWIIGIVAGGVVVVVVVALLLLIINEARRILHAAVRCLTAVRAIRPQVEPIWALQTTNEVATEIVGGARSIEAKARLLADALEAHEKQPVRSA
ncbi:MAG: hypothetical protein ACYDAC_05155 [Candidatus Dormibacteria bacterium]